CSREVAAFSSPPRPSKISAISCAEYEPVPLKSRCSMKWETPARASGSSRDPAPIQKPSATERTLVTRSVISRSPESSSERTYSCTQKMLVGRGRCPGEDALIADVHDRLRRLVRQNEGRYRRRPVGRVAGRARSRLEVVQEPRVLAVAHRRLRGRDKAAVGPAVSDHRGHEAVQ